MKSAGRRKEGWVSGWVGGEGNSGETVNVFLFVTHVIDSSTVSRNPLEVFFVLLLIIHFNQPYKSPSR